MRAHHNNIVLRQTFILIVAGAFTANAQTLVGSLGAMGIAGTLQSINSTAAINGLNAANGVTGINAQQNAAVNQALNGTPPQGSNAGNVTGSVTINGVTQALGTAPGGLPGMGGGLPGMGGGLPGMGGGAPSSAMQGAFDPDQVKVNGLNSPMFNMTAKQILDVVAMSFDHPIQYVVLDQGIMFFQQDPKFAGTVTQTFRLNLNSRSLAQLGIQTPQLGQGGGGGQNGGQGNGAGQQGGGPDGAYPGGQGAGGGYPGGEDPGMEMQKYPARNNFRPFNSMGGYRFNSITPGYGPSRVRGRQ